jgi:aryl-phospho-beta-D-glucosidase BglC (GH1 family)
MRKIRTISVFFTSKTRLVVAIAVGLLGVLATAIPASAQPCPVVTKFDFWPSGKALLRGANVFMGRNPGGGPGGFGDGAFTQTDFDDLAQAGANYVQISHAGLFGEQFPYALDQAAQDNLDNILAMAGQAGLYAVIAFRSGPGRNENAITGRDGVVLETIWTDAQAQAAWVEMLRYAASRYRDYGFVVGIDPMVEPNDFARQGFPDPATFYAMYGGTLEDYNTLAANVTTAIREVDPSIPILLEPEGFGGVAWLPYLQVTGDPLTVYTVHDYTPDAYTSELDPAATYPGFYTQNGVPVLVDKAYLDNYLDTLRTFSAQNGVPVAVTEFGAHRTAPNSDGYLQDRVDLQDGIGNWAAWVWQPAGFADPFSMHDPSPANLVLSAAWQANCH